MVGSTRPCSRRGSSSSDFVRARHEVGDADASVLLAGGGVILAYAIYRRDPVFMLGQATGLFIYARNLWLIRDEKRAA